MSELKYRPISPLYLHMSLEDQIQCLKNGDPFLGMETRRGGECDTSDDDLDLKNFKPDKVDQTCPLNNTHRPQQTTNYMQHQTATGNSPQNAVKTTEEVYRDAIIRAASNGTYTVNVPVAEAWIKEHFQHQSKMSVARAAVYEVYLEHCRKHDVPSCNPATFGKVIRNVFPFIKTRRIGNRGHSKYHYYGIGPTEKAKGLISCAHGRRLNRHCFGEFQKQEINMANEVVVKAEVQDVLQTSEKAVLCALKYFPVQVPEKFPATLKQRMEQFLGFYQSHNSDVLASLMKAEFEKVTCCITEFWRTLPLSFASEDFSGRPEVVELVQSCDQVVYSAMKEILVPNKQMKYDPGLMEYVQQFINCLDTCLELSMATLPALIQTFKISACQSFQREICRELQYCHLYSSCRAILQNPEAVRDMLSDIQNINVDNLLAECASITTQPLSKDILCHYLGQIQSNLLNNKCLEDYLILAEKIVENTNYIQRHMETKSSVQNLILEWSYIAGNIIKQLSLSMAKSLGSFHLIDVFLREHLLFKFSH